MPLSKNTNQIISPVNLSHSLSLHITHMYADSLNDFNVNSKR